MSEGKQGVAASTGSCARRCRGRGSLAPPAAIVRAAASKCGGHVHAPSPESDNVAHQARSRYEGVGRWSRSSREGSERGNSVPALSHVRQNPHMHASMTKCRNVDGSGTTHLHEKEKEKGKISHNDLGSNCIAYQQTRLIIPASTGNVRRCDRTGLSRISRS